MEKLPTPKMKLSSIQLKKPVIPVLIKIEYALKNGDFSFQTSRGTYFIMASMAGYKAVISPSFEIAAETKVVAPGIQLQAISTKLKELTVTARKPLIEVKGDKTVFNVEGSINAHGSNLLESLKNHPA